MVNLININLTPDSYYSTMRMFRDKTAPSVTREKSGFLSALAVALALHAIVLLLPMTVRTPVEKVVSAQIDVQLITVEKDAALPQVPEQQPDTMERNTLPDTRPEPLPEPGLKPVVPEKLAESRQATEPPRLIPAPPLREPGRYLEKMTPEQKTRLTNIILSQPFINEESVVDAIFGKPIDLPSTEPQKEFHFPARQNMISMLDQPLPELPFAYTPDLVYFAYDPGLRGDIQRFWDVITPEFGWRTDNGTEFKCKWVLIIAACGWK